MALSTGVCGRMPCPRLKMWPGRPAAISSICCTRRRSSCRSASSDAGVEVALDRLDRCRWPARRRRVACASRRRPRAASLGQQRIQDRIAGREVDHRNTGSKTGDDLLHIGQHVLPIVVHAQAADPGIEQLHGLSTGGDLGIQVAGDGAGETLHQCLPGTRVAIHQRLGVQVVAAGSSFDRVAGQRKRCTGKTRSPADGRAGPAASGAPFPSRSAAHRRSRVPPPDRRRALRAPDCESPDHRRRRIPGPAPSARESAADRRR